MLRARWRSRGPLLRVVDLRVEFRTTRGRVRAVDGVSFSLDRGEALAIVGESGSGKSVTALSVMRLLPEPPARVTGGRVLLRGRDILDLPEEDMARVRGREMAMVFQEPAGALNPVMTVGRQVMEAVTAHRAVTGREARHLALLALAEAGVPSPAARFGHFPHQLSGGMKQRVMIAMALACNPKLLIADEPTTALDVTVQAQIMELMKELKDKFDTSIMLITHDLGVVAGMASRVLVMYAGKIIEEGTVRDIYYNPQHPYTWSLLRSVPRLDAASKKRLLPIHGQPPDLLDPPKGCRFNPRCDYALKICLQEEPEYTYVNGGHKVACWRQHPEAPPFRPEEERGRSA
ncbi:MAG TPA: peptide ABC transporter ATP-binding protein [Clostridiales bacterium]|nr:peptide ABC transporter ATP-binding protein [Clostridiales bacterium]